MSVPEILPDTANRTAARPAGPARLTAWVDAASVAVSDRLNPLLVKEVRQALKSRQFLVTFSLLLASAWMWSIVALYLNPPEELLKPVGWELFQGYYFILAFALLVAVPYACYQSMTAERDDNTLELVTVSTLRPRQIVAGKLLSAAVQIVLHTSILAPCLAFTYLLRGVDLVGMLWLLGLTIAASLGLALLGLTMATYVTEKHWNLLLSLLLLGYLFGAFIAACNIVGDGPAEIRGPIFRAQEFLAIIPAVAAIYAAYCVFLARLAASRLTFAADNRSTGVRWAALAPHTAILALAGLLAFHPLFNASPMVQLVPFTILAVQWAAFGVFLQCESPDLSRRVRRQLPRSVLGRVFLAWFAPGPGTGHVFAVLGVVSAGLVAGFLAWRTANAPSTTAAVAVLGSTRATAQAALQTELRWVMATILAVAGYVAFYLGLGLLLARWFRKLRSMTALALLLVQPLPLLLGTVGPLLLETMLYGSVREYSLLQLSNPFWTCAEFANWRMIIDAYSLGLLVWSAALLVLMLNLRSILQELRQVRIAAPSRVALDDAQLSGHGLHGPRNPWEASDDT